MRIDNLPQYPTPFVGRRAELTALTHLLNDPACRLLTLVGLGGVGKTRLAIEIVNHVIGDFPDGVYFIPLQPLQSADQVLPTIIDTLAFQNMGESQQELFDYLRDKRLLLVLDNFEHVLAASALVDEILTSAPGVVILITSREVLKLQGEWVRRVDGLDYPENDETTSDIHWSAVELFAQNARRLRDNFELERQYEQIVRIAELVEGMPLGLELAAGWTNVLTCTEIASEIQRKLDFLASDTRNFPERHRSIQVVFDQSWRLLTEEEREVMQRFTVFHGGCLRHAAEQVTGASLQILAVLISKSLLRLDNDGRYTLHELVRQYAHEQLVLAGTDSNAYDAHSAYYAEYIASRVDDLKGRRQIEAIVEINADFENVRTAWNWAATHKKRDTIEPMIDGLWIFCSLRNRDQDRLAIFHYATQLFAPEDGDEPTRLWGRLLARSTDGEVGQAQIETALEIAQQADDRSEVAFCMHRLSLNAHDQQNYDKAEYFIEESLKIYRQLDDPYATAGVLGKMMEYGYDGYYERFSALGEDYGAEALAIKREIGDHVGAAWSLIGAALQEGRVGNYAEAERLWHERISLGYEIGNLGLAALGYAHVCHKIYFIQGNFDQARSTAEEAIKIWTRINFGLVKGWALATLGLLASMNDDYTEAISLCQEAAYYADHPLIVELTAWSFSIAYCGLDNYRAAREQLLRATEFMTVILGSVGKVCSLPIMAIIQAYQGQSQQAVELLALAMTHPIKAAGWMQKWPLLARFQADLEAELGETVYAAAWQRGTTLDLESTHQRILHSLQSEQNTPDLSANRQLADPLSPRELEVLALIVEGFTNREIADRLYIGINTVKKHVNHIYSKLDVKDRTEAVNCAKKSGLIS